MCAMQNSSAPIATEVLKRGPAQFDMVGKHLGYSLHKVDEVITHGLAHRLACYATRRMAESGFLPFIRGSKLEVYTTDGDERPTDRSYCVRWQSEQGGYIEVIGILTKHGWPCLDHGFAIGEE